MAFIWNTAAIKLLPSLLRKPLCSRCAACVALHFKSFRSFVCSFIVESSGARARASRRTRQQPPNKNQFKTKSINCIKIQSNDMLMLMFILFMFMLRLTCDGFPKISPMICVVINKFYLSLSPSLQLTHFPHSHSQRHTHARIPQTTIFCTKYTMDATHHTLQCQISINERFWH